MTQSLSRNELMECIRSGAQMSRAQQFKLSVLLCLPAILAQLSTVLMEYIDAGMVGRLGANQSASVGLVSTTTWLFGGLCMATSSGFSVQVAHLLGAGNFKKARQVLREAITSNLAFSTILAIAGVLISSSLPIWLGGGSDITADAAAYFLIYSAFLPFMAICFSAGAMLQASGNMKVPSLLNVVMCLLDVILNYIFIYKMGLGVKGAALGTGIAEVLTAAAMLWFLVVRSPELNLIQDKGSFLPGKETLNTALRITSPIWLENMVMRGAHIASTVIVAPLGTIAIAANAFAITAESFCYMPGFGMQEASTTLIGQSLGAKRRELARSFSYINVLGGALMMGFLAVFMYFLAPQLMGILTTDPQVLELGAIVLRIEAFAELMYGASIVAYGCFVGAGDTLIPSIMNLASMWVVRIGLALWLTPKYGLVGYWVAMCIELNFRGAIFIARLFGNKWMKTRIKTTDE